MSLTNRNQYQFKMVQCYSLCHIVSAAVCLEHPLILIFARIAMAQAQDYLIYKDPLVFYQHYSLQKPRSNKHDYLTISIFNSNGVSVN